MLVACQAEPTPTEGCSLPPFVEIDRTVDRLFDAISFTEQSGPTISELSELFVPEGLLTRYSGQGTEPVTVTRFIGAFEASVSTGQLTELHETETASETVVFDQMAYRYSFFEARQKESDSDPFAVGLNSIQLLALDGEWRIVSMMWQDLNPELLAVTLENLPTESIAHTEAGYRQSCIRINVSD